MKKYYIFLLVVFLSFTTFVIFNKTNNNDNKFTKIRLAEVTHSTFYAPLYIAIENGYFKEEGLDVELVLTPGADKVSAAVLSGDVNIGFAGAESAIYVYNGGEKDYLKIFSGLTKRDGQFILGRSNDNSFNLSNLKDKEILVGRKGGMPALNFLNALKNCGIDPRDININYSVDFASLSGAFISGTGDYVNLFEPNASILEKEKKGYILSSIGKLSGEMPYTVFYAKKSYIKNNQDTTKKFNRAINKGLKFTQEKSSNEIAKIISNQFPDNSINDLTLMIDNYKKADSWLSDSNISEESLDNLQNLLIDNKLIDKKVNFKDLIINYE